MLGFSLVRTEVLIELKKDSAALRRYQRGENKVAHENTKRTPPPPGEPGPAEPPRLPRRRFRRG